MPLPSAWTLQDILGLSLMPRIKATVLRRFVEQFFSLEELLSSEHPELTKVGIYAHSLFPAKIMTEIYDLANKQQDLCKHCGVSIVTYWDDDYPQYLREIYYPPSLLYLRGKLRPPDTPSISMVGTRHCTDYGKFIAEQYASYFAGASITIVSGLANGIDMVCHKTVLAHTGVTYAVVASGLDKISPYSAAQTAEQIALHGAVISEYPCGTVAQRTYFPQRNRIISGLSQATIVIESGEKGGSLITAQFALDQNRELFAVPGRISSEKSKGTNRLIQRGHAQLTLEPVDVLEYLGWQVSSAPPVQTTLHTEFSQPEQQVLQQLSDEPLHIDALAEICGVSVHELLVLLLELEFKNVIRQLPGKQFVKV